MPASGRINRSIGLASTALAIVAIVLAFWISQGQSTARSDATSTLFSPTAVTGSVGSTAHIEVVGSGLDSAINGVQINVQHSIAITVSNVACEGVFQGTFQVGPIAVNGGTLFGCIFVRSATVSGDGVVISFDISSSGPTSETLTFGIGPLFSTTYTAGDFVVAPGTLNSLDVSFAGTVGEIVGIIQLQNQTVIPGEVTLTLSPGGQTATTDGNGGFSFPALTPGTYSVLAELPGFLSAQRVNINVPDQQIDIGTTEPRSGDVNRDGAITIQDISTVASNFGSGSPQPW